MKKLFIYCAGGDVFLPAPQREQVFAAMRHLAAELSDGLLVFEVLIPLDNEIEWSEGQDADSKRSNALKIRLANEAMIRRCDAVIANLSPFRGPEPDCGTAYECGFARALGKDVLVYTDNFSEQTERYAHFDFEQAADDQRYAYREVEDFALPFNLMMYGTDYPIFDSFASALKAYAARQRAV